MKLTKILTLLAAPILLGLLAVNCSNEDGVTTSFKDVSSRVTGFSTEVTGAASTLTINGNGLDKATQVFIGNFVVPAKRFAEVTSTSITLQVPSTVGVGENRVLVVFPGNERAISSIEVVKVPLIGSVSPSFGVTDAVITISGSGFANVNSVLVNGTAAEITEKNEASIKFKVPAGATTGKITLSAVTGDVSTTSNFVTCSSDPQSICIPPINLNSSFELGTGDVFTNWNKFNGAALLVETKVAAEVHEGVRALKVKVDGTQGGTQQWRIQMASDEFVTTPGTTYKVSGWFKAAAAGGKIRYSTAYPSNTGAQYHADTSVGTDWTKIEWTFSANEAKARIVLDLGGPFNTTYFVDEVTVKP